MSPYWPEFLKLALAHMLAVASPGPDFAIVLRQSLTFGRRTALWTAIGIGCGICLHVIYSLFGLGVLLKSSPTAFTVVKFAGAAYLAWIGFKSLRTRPRADPDGADSPLNALGAKAPIPPSERSAWSVGFFTNALNPKATLFFVAIFATLVSPLTPLPIRIGYGVWISLSTMAWFSFVAYVITRERVRRRFLRYGHWIDRTLGAVFLIFAAALAFAAAPGATK